MIVEGGFFAAVRNVDHHMPADQLVDHLAAQFGQPLPGLVGSSRQLVRRSLVESGQVRAVGRLDHTQAGIEPLLHLAGLAIQQRYLLAVEEDTVLSVLPDRL